MHEEYASDGVELAFAGGLYGLVLCVIGLLAAGWGHGTYLPIAVFGAPFGILLDPLALFACLVWWPVVGFTIGASRRPWIAIVLLLTHASAVVAMLVFGTPWESADDQWLYYDRARVHYGAMLFTGWVVYVIGQAIGWSMVLVRWLSSERAPDYAHDFASK